MSDQLETRGATDYLFDTGSDLGGEQVNQLSTLLDTATLTAIDATGVEPGWRCMDVGAGGGSVTRALAERTGPYGRVIAVDLVTDYLDAIDGVEVYRHDITQGLPTHGPFDLIHARLVLLHLPRRLEVLGTLIDALAPGGWLVLGEYSGRLPYALAAATADDVMLFDRVMDIGHHVVGVEAGKSLTWAHEVPGLMLDAGLTDVHGHELSTTVTGGDSACRYLYSLAGQLVPHLERAGLSDAELTRFGKLMHDPRFRGWFYQFVCTRGRKGRKQSSSPEPLRT